MNAASSGITRLRRILLSKPALIAGALLIIYTISGFLLAPWLVQQQFPKIVEQQLGGQGSIAAVRINPFLLTFEATGLSIAEKETMPALQVARIFVDLETSSLLRWAWTFREIRIEQPVVYADLDASESLNFLRLLAPLLQTTPERSKSDAPPRLLLQHLAIAGGVFGFTDHTLTPAAKTQINPIDFEIHDVSTLPDHRGEHQLNARLPGGGNLQWQGSLSLSPIESTGMIALKDARLSTPWKFVRDHLTIAEPQGTYNFRVRYRLGYSDGALKLETDDLAFGLKDVVIAQQQGGALLGKLAAVDLKGGSFNLARRSLVFKDVHVADGALNVVLDEDSVPDWAKLVLSSPSSAKPAAVNEALTTDADKAVAPWEISLPQINVESLALSITDYSRAKPLRILSAKSVATLGIAVAVGKQMQVVVDKGALSLENIRITTVEEKQPPVTLDSAEINGISVNLQERTLRAELARLTGGRTWIRRDAAGDLQLVSMLAPRKVELVKELQKKGFSIALDRAEIAGYAVALTDESFQPAIRYDLEQLNATASKIAFPPTNPSSFEMSLRVKQGGSIKAKGTLDLRQPGADVRFEVADVELTPLDAIIKRETTLTLSSGKAGASGRVILDAKSAPASIRYTGTATVTNLDILSSGSDKRLVGWKRLIATEINFSSADNRLAIANVGITEPYARLIVNKDRSTNLADIKRAAPGKASAVAPAVAPAAPASSNTPTAGKSAVSVARVSIENGSMDFADFSLVLPFEAYIQALGGSVNGLSSAADSRATLKLEGRIAEYGLARAEGGIQPFAPKKFTDIGVVFRNVEMSRLSPYTATFAGRKIDSGRMSLDLQYKIENSSLAGENKVLLDKLTLGERVESPTAANLPLDLAIALLTDSNGKIDLELPVSGNVDAPEFSYGSVVWQAITTVISNIVTAPFRALGAVFGANAETLGEIVFDPGSARILPTEYEKLQRVAEGLQKRPQLKLTVQGVYHTESDGHALRTTAVRADLAAREGLKLAAGEEPGAVAFDSAKTQRAIENMLSARAGGDALVQFVETFRKTAGHEANRVSPVLAAMNRGAGDRELYVAMYQRLIELQPLPAPALSDLATARTEAITGAFTNLLKVDPARVDRKAIEAVDERAKNGVPAKLSFAPMK